MCCVYLCVSVEEGGGEGVGGGGGSNSEGLQNNDILCPILHYMYL